MRMKLIKKKKKVNKVFLINHLIFKLIVSQITLKLKLKEKVLD
jgi:hypothetical protein